MRQLAGAGTASGHDDVRVVVPEGTAAPATVPPGIFASAAGPPGAGHGRAGGVARITAVIGGVLGAVERDKPLRAFLDSDPEAALRILTGTRSRVQQGMAGALSAGPSP